MPNKFKTNYAFERREQESSKILTKYPDKIQLLSSVLKNVKVLKT